MRDTATADGGKPQRRAFIDSSGINTFLIAYQAASSAQGWLRIASAQEAVLGVLQIVGLDKVIPCRPTIEQALTAG
ncbi:STAS domain-containing protein [Streptomyces sp. Qhu-G9]|uniref:STAS domain-containing protein n=1 Tax=Streptomyces sp. Qhu-G9 TaxID=3452799 RepID=UPI002F2B1C8B